MNVTQYEFELASDGHGHVYDLTDDVVAWLGSIAASNGQLTVFVPGSTAVITTIEFEPGAPRFAMGGRQWIFAPASSPVGPLFDCACIPGTMCSRHLAADRAC